MMTRLFAALAALAVGGAALAQPPTAPPPRLSLEELVREYRRLGLPLAPPDAELVRFPNGWRPETGFRLGFRLPRENPRELVMVLVGAKTNYARPDELRSFDPRTDSLRDLEPEWVSDLLCLAAQCYINGRTEYARVLYASALEGISHPVPAVLKDAGFLGTSWKQRVNGWELHLKSGPHAVQDELREAAFQHWYPKIQSPDADRPELLRYLKLTAGNNSSVYDDLERTLAPRTSRPGTAEALIDDLTEFRSERGSGWGIRTPTPPPPEEGAYWKLAELGFDAVPALIEHTDDPRYTRAVYGQIHKLGTSTHLLRVGFFARELLSGFAGDTIGTDDGWEGGARTWWERAAVRAWWEAAWRVGEEKWLTARALPAPPRGRDDESERPNRIICRALGAKYPARLAEVYRTTLRTRPRLESDILAQEVAASRLPHAVKVALLAEGVAHRQPAHQHAALRSLAVVDRDAFRAALLARLATFPREAQKGREGTPEIAIAGLVDQADDPACWAALAAVTRRASVDLRLDVITQASWYWNDAYARNTAPRPGRLRFLLGFLTDTTGLRGWVPHNYRWNSYPRDSAHDITVQVRDIAAARLAWELGWYFDFKPERGPEARRVIREAVREAATRELAARK